MAATLARAALGVWCVTGAVAAAPATQDAVVGYGHPGGQSGFVVVASNQDSVTWWHTR